MKVRPVFDRNRGSVKVADEYGGDVELNFLCRLHRPIDLSADRHRCGGKRSLDEALFPHDQAARGMDFSFNFPVDSDISATIDHTCEVSPFPEQGQVLVIADGLRDFFPRSPHEYPTLLSKVT